MADSEDDLDLKRAIALSLREDNSPFTDANEVIDLDSGSDIPVVATPQSSQQAGTQQLGRGTLNSMLGLDRKAMEEERLARKRKLASISPPSRKAPKLTQSQYNSTPKGKTEESSSTASTADNIASDPKPKGFDFPNGTIKKTWALGHPRTGDDIKVEEVLQRQDLTLAVLSSFQWDFDWLVQKLDTRKTQLVFVVQAKTDHIRQQYSKDFAGIPNVRLCFPSMEGQVICMHSKLMLLSHPGYLRVVVPTANLVPYDWGDGGVMENSVFLIDLLRLPEGKNTALEDMTFFGQELIYFLGAM